MATTTEPLRLKAELETWIKSEVAKQAGDFSAVKPGHYKPWRWPIHPVSYDYHIPASEWHGSAILEHAGQSFPVVVARTPWGVFGRCEILRAEAKGDSEEDMLLTLLDTCEPLFGRRNQVGELLGLGGPYQGRMRELDALSLLKLFFAADRSIAHDAQKELETKGGLATYGPALVAILNETKHRHRRTAQWLVLDLFEDLTSYCPGPEAEAEALAAIRNMMWNAEDDFARTIYKAGVVLGGHVCTPDAAETIIELMSAPSRIARRSAMHASFHLCEWMPIRKNQVMETLRRATEEDSEPLLRAYSAGLMKDIQNEVVDHIAEPIFDDEP
ncbi:MAG: hypothetical protein JNK63_09545 [Chthonomonas sp.]|nr:hypothetical protein [Chthonomonas sp.]